MSYIYFVYNRVKHMIFFIIIFTSNLCLCKCTQCYEIAYIYSVSKIYSIGLLYNYFVLHENSFKL